MARVRQKSVRANNTSKNTSKGNSKKKKATDTRRRGPGRALWFKLGLTLLLVLAAYLLYQDIRIRYHFEGKRWALPARVYARPLELYAGRQLGTDELLHELKLLQYRPVRAPADAGSYQHNGNDFVLSTRPFMFWDGDEPARSVRIRMAAGRVDAISDVRTGAAVPLLRLDPAHIASIYPSHNEDRVLVRVDEVPELLLQGLVVVEDRQFYHHHGIDPLAIVRALWANIRAGHTVQGGSTLTQQLIKNYFLSNERSLWRKVNEASMALLLESHYDKREIIEAYLNEIYLGQDGKRSIHGFGLASQFYFQRPLDRLQLHEYALLIGLVKGPSYYDPRRFPERARERRNLVLKLMSEQGIISGDQYRQAAGRPLGVSERAPSGVTRYPAFLDLVRRQLRRDYREEDLASAGLNIFTTLDPLLQHHAEQGLTRQVGALERVHAMEASSLQGAVVITGVGNGEVLAMVGDRNPRYAGFNRALDAVRPIGSLVKPAVYLAALSDPGRYTLATLLSDEPFTLETDDGKVWSPQNYDHELHGQVPLATALADSLNIATARLGLDVGLEKVADTLRTMGVERPFRAYPAMLLGSVSLSPLEVAQMYQTLSGGGFHTPLRSIRAVLDVDGRPLQRYPLTVSQALDADTTYLLNAGLQQVMRAGTGRSIYASLPRSLDVAGKTGTTNDLRDSWFSGFSGDYQMVVWLGMDDNRPSGLTGSSGALKVWGEVMGRIHPAPLLLTPTDNTELVWIEPLRGAKSAQHCEGAVQLPFIKGSAPDREAPCGNRALNWLKELVH